MENGWDCKKELKSLTAMAAVECIHVSLNTLYKAASLTGLTYYVLVTYSYALGALVLLPFIFIFPRSSTTLPPLSLSLLLKIIILSVLGYAGHICGFKGIEYSSLALFSAISNLSPAFIFILAVVFSMETLDLRCKRTQAKTIGTVVSISGTFIAILYKGPVIWSPSSPSSTSSLSFEPSLQTSSTSWVIGGLVLLGFAMVNSLRYILQTWIIKSYPYELIVVVLFSLYTSTIVAIVAFVVGTDPIAWTLRSDKALLTIVLFGFFGPSFRAAVHTWGLNIKGPVYIAIFRPFSFFIASAMGVLFLGDVLYLGSVIGATLLLLGFCAVIWGKAKEDQITRDVEFDSSESQETIA